MRCGRRWAREPRVADMRRLLNPVALDFGTVQRNEYRRGTVGSRRSTTGVVYTRKPGAFQACVILST